MKSMVMTMVVWLVPTVACAASLDKIQFIKISPQESRAVIKTPEGVLQVIKPGDTIAEHTTVKEIIPDRIILEETTVNGVETVIVRKVNDKTSIERLRRNPDRPPPLLAPAAPGN